MTKKSTKKSQPKKGKTTKPRRVIRVRPGHYKATTVELARCAIFALKFLDAKSGGGMRVRHNAEGGIEKIERWQDTFMDALDKAGVIVDRDEYWKSKIEKPKKGRN